MSRTMPPAAGRHDRYLSGRIRHNPLPIVSRRLGHASPETTHAYLEYPDDLINEFEEAFSRWVGDADEETALCPDRRARLRDGAGGFAG
jgi:hypothetical protein